MSAVMAAGRRRVVLAMGVAALASAGLAVAALLPPREDAARAEVGQLVVPGFEARAADASLVMVTTGEESYHLVRDAEGWVLTEKGRYPVRPERVGELVRAMATLRYAEALTRDERKFDRIGLGDPAEGGTGALVEIGDGSGTAFARLIIGYRNGRSYVRAPDDLQAWRVEGGALPPLQRGARWLDLDVAGSKPEEIASVDVRLTGFAPYRLVPSDAAGTAFVLAPPYDRRRVTAALAPSLPARALAGFAPVDVAPVAQIAGAQIAGAQAVGEHATTLRDGTVVTVKLWRAGEAGWVTVAATGPGAEAINARAEGWAFALADNAWNTFATPLAAIVEPQ
jgi:hypothetical protein